MMPASGGGAAPRHPQSLPPAPRSWPPALPAWLWDLQLGAPAQPGAPLPPPEALTASRELCWPPGSFGELRGPLGGFGIPFLVSEELWWPLGSFGGPWESLLSSRKLYFIPKPSRL